MSAPSKAGAIIPTYDLLIDKTSSLPELNAVFANDFKGGMLAKTYLRKLGHRRIGYIGSGGDSEHYAYQHRFWGFRAGISESVSDSELKKFIHVYNPENSTPEEAFNKLLSTSPRMNS